MTTRPLTLTSPDRATLGTLLASRNAANDEAGVLADLMLAMGEAAIVHSEDVPPTLVTLNTCVRVRMHGTDVAREFTVVVPGHADFRKGRISVLTPVGAALLGRREGDTVECDVPAGRVRFRIETVLYQPEAAAGSGVATT